MKWGIAYYRFLDRKKAVMEIFWVEGFIAGPSRTWTVVKPLE